MKIFNEIQPTEVFEAHALVIIVDVFSVFKIGRFAVEK